MLTILVYSTDSKKKNLSVNHEQDILITLVTIVAFVANGKITSGK